MAEAPRDATKVVPKHFQIARKQKRSVLARTFPFTKEKKAVLKRRQLVNVPRTRFEKPTKTEPKEIPAVEPSSDTLVLRGFQAPETPGIWKPQIKYTDIGYYPNPLDTFLLRRAHNRVIDTWLVANGFASRSAPPPAVSPEYSLCTTAIGSSSSTVGADSPQSMFTVTDLERPVVAAAILDALNTCIIGPPADTTAYGCNTNVYSQSAVAVDSPGTVEQEEVVKIIAADINPIVTPKPLVSNLPTPRIVTETTTTNAEVAVEPDTTTSFHQNSESTTEGPDQNPESGTSNGSSQKPETTEKRVTFSNDVDNPPSKREGRVARRSSYAIARKPLPTILEAPLERSPDRDGKIALPLRDRTNTSRQLPRAHSLRRLAVHNSARASITDVAPDETTANHDNES